MVAQSHRTTFNRWCNYPSGARRDSSEDPCHYMECGRFLLWSRRTALHARLVPAARLHRPAGTVHQARYRPWSVASAGTHTSIRRLFRIRRLSLRSRLLLRQLGIACGPERRRERRHMLSIASREACCGTRKTGSSKEGSLLSVRRATQLIPEKACSLAYSGAPGLGIQHTK